MKKTIFSLILGSIITLFIMSDQKPNEFDSGTIQIALIASDFDKSLDFYKNVLGMQETGGFNVGEDFAKRSGLTDGRPLKVTTLKLEDSEQATTWKLMTFNEKPTHPKQNFIHNDTGVQYVTIYVKSLDPFLERLKENNIPMQGECPLKAGKDDFVLIQDPDGLFIELISRN